MHLFDHIPKHIFVMIANYKPSKGVPASSIIISWRINGLSLTLLPSIFLTVDFKTVTHFTLYFISDLY